MTQVRSMHTATAQAIQPCCLCWLAVWRMWVNDPAAAIEPRTMTGPESAAAAPRRESIRRPAVR